MKFKAGIIGYGKLGSTLAEALTDTHNLLWIVDKNEKAKSIAKENFKNIPVLKSIYDITEIPDYIFLCVYDSAIEATAEQLAETLKENLKDKYVIHCSGALTPDILNSCKLYGAKTASVHPYQTFYYPSKELLNGIGWSIQTYEDSGELIELVKKLGGNPEVIPNDERITSLYHCSAVVASNFMNTLLSLSEDIAKLAGIDVDRFIPPIVRTTVENNLGDPLQGIPKQALGNKKEERLVFGNKKEDGENFPLTGPFASGEIDIIKKHVEALQDHPHLLKLYCYLGLATIEKAREHGVLNDNNLNEIERILMFYLKNNLS